MMRIFANLLIILSIFILPLYLSVILIFIAIYIFNGFAEAIIFGYLIDLIYGSGSIFGLHFAYFFTVLMLATFIVSFKLKKVLR